MEPPAPLTTTVYLRDEGSGVTQTVQRAGSITLGQLHCEYDITGVVECEASGKAAKRAVIITDPAAMLHSGQTYICKKTSGKGIKFCDTVKVHEYTLPTPDGKASITFSGRACGMAGGGAATSTGSAYPPATVDVELEPGKTTAVPWAEVQAVLDAAARGEFSTTETRFDDAIRQAEHTMRANRAMLKALTA